MKCDFVNIKESVREPYVPNLPGVQPRRRFFMGVGVFMLQQDLNMCDITILVYNVYITNKTISGVFYLFKKILF